MDFTGQSNFGSTPEPASAAAGTSIPVSVGTTTSHASTSEPTPERHFDPSSIYPDPIDTATKQQDKPVDVASQIQAHANQLSSENTSSDQPVPVVKVLSVRGVEYGMMTITLWIAATAFAAGIMSIINGGAGFAVLALPLSLLLVCGPVFAYLFLRLKKAELLNPSLKMEASKRRFSQLTQFLAFLVCLVNLITFVYLVISSFGGESHISWGKTIGNLIVIMVIAGGILSYYWGDEHRQA